MKRLGLAAFAALVVCCLSGQPVQAQFGRYTRPQTMPYYRPPVSPYLNLLRGGGAAAGINYYTLTRPQIQTYTQLQTLQSEVQTLQTNPLSGLPVQGSNTTPVLITGHPVRFFSVAPFYTSYPIPRPSVSR
jgi:hypothetical protein